MPTTSSGLTPLCGSLPLNIALTASTTAGIRVMPPTRMTSSMSPALSPASLSAASTGFFVFSGRSRTRARRFARGRVTTGALELGPREGHDEVLRAGGVGRDVWQVGLGRGRRAELDLRLLGGLL